MNSTTLTQETLSQERPQNPTHFGGEGLYDESAVQEAEPLKAPLGEQIDQATRQSIQAVNRTGQTLWNTVRRNPIPVALALGGLAYLFVSMARRSTRH